MRNTIKVAAPLVAFALAASACGGGGSDKDKSGTAGGTKTADTKTADTKTADSKTADTKTADTMSDGTHTMSDGATMTGDTMTGDTKSSTAAPVDPASIKTDVGIDDKTITVGMLADLSGPFSGLVTEAVAAQQVFWDDVNAKGGIAGRQVKLVIEDNAYDVATQQQKYATIKDKVAMLSHSTGSPHTAAIAGDLVKDNLLAIPLSWYSGWAFDEVGGKVLGQNVLESYTNYCMESMNGVEWLSKNKQVKKVAIISFPGEYGGDGAAGAMKAAEALGLEVVYDGTGKVTPPSADNPNPDQSSVISEIVKAKPDLVWTTINPATLTSILSGAVSQGYTGLFSGNSPSYSFKMLATDVKDALDKHYIASTYIVTWGTDVPGMKNLVDTMTKAKPDLQVSDVYILGWTEGEIAKAVLDQAAANGDMTRAGIVKASKEVSVKFQGLAPDQTWSGNPNDFAVRQSFIYDVDLKKFNPQPLSAGTGGTGWSLLEGPYTGELAAKYDFTQPCFVSS